jgi:hypothetical protein
MKKNKMTIAVLGCIGIFLITALMLVPAAQSAEKTVKYNYTTQLTKVEFVVLPDMKGHVTGVFERRGVAIFEDEVAALKIWGTFDKKKGRVSFLAYLQITFKDGSTVMQKASGSHAPPPDEKLDVYEGKGEYINGTGRFEGIKGNLSLTGKQITPYTKDETKADNWIEVTATYTLPKK